MNTNTEYFTAALEQLTAAKANTAEAAAAARRAAAALRAAAAQVRSAAEHMLAPVNLNDELADGQSGYKLIAQKDDTLEPLAAAFASPAEILFASVKSSYTGDLDSSEALAIYTPAEFNAGYAEGRAVYCSSSRRSLFNCFADTLDALKAAGYTLHAVDEYEHSSYALRLSSGKRCEFDSSTAYIAMPPGSSAPTQAQHDELENWMNGIEYYVAVYSLDLNIGELEELDSCAGFYTEQRAIQSATEELARRVAAAKKGGQE